MRSRHNRQRGAALVEMAIILPLFVLMIFGMIEAGWAFAQANDVRHGAREGARLAAVNHGDLATIGAEVCDRMDIVVSSATSVTLIAVSDVNTDGDPVAVGSGNGSRNAQARIVVTSTSPGLTGVIAGFTNVNLTSDIDFRLEQPATGDADWWAAASASGGGTHTCGS